MGLQKGKTNNPAGRPSGSLNKLSKDLRKNITDFLEENFEVVKLEWQKLEGKDKLQFYKDLIQYAIPKMQTMEFQSEFERLSDEDLDRIINELKGGAK
jgi:predicted ATP-grasp superfamily ATP-dependent carboligase